VQAANRESLYHAVDLMQLEVPAGSTVSVAHDDRLPRPPWLLARFQATSTRLSVGGVAMSLFRAEVAQDESLTLGPNTEEAKAPAANMYLVFVQGASR